jgi:lysophospholipid acyltransferase (LPLAT)-like uncharacterized protein
MILHNAAKYLIWFVIKALTSTYKIEIRGTENRDKAKLIHPKGSFIFAVWHEHVVSVMTAHAWTEPYLALSSRSKDGDYAAFVSVKMGFTAVRGSSRKKGVDKGGKEAMQEYKEKLGTGLSGGLTVDGPKGPRQVCKVGIALISQESGAPILPVTGLANRYWQFNSWDKFKIPKPFAKIVMTYGEPIIVEKSEDPALAAERVTQALKSLENPK